MATRKYTVTLPEELAEEIRGEVGPGAFSAYVTHAIERQREHDRLGELVAWMEEKHDVPDRRGAGNQGRGRRGDQAAG